MTCGKCGHDHSSNPEWELFREKILQAHLEDGLLDRINADRATRNEPAWDADHLLAVLDASADLLDD